MYMDYIYITHMSRGFFRIISKTKVRCGNGCGFQVLLADLGRTPFFFLVSSLFLVSFRSLNCWIGLFCSRPPDFPSPRFKP